MKKTTGDEYSDKEAAKRTEDTIRRLFLVPHTPRKAIVGITPRAKAQQQRRAKGSPKSK